jgi:acyl-CoA synthetase (AMP-forming)/AMP-acid ligase II
MCMIQVLEAAVIAIPHPKWTERPLLVVVSAEGSKLTKEDMLNFLQVLHTIACCTRSCICFLQHNVVRQSEQCAARYARSCFANA